MKKTSTTHLVSPLQEDAFSEEMLHKIVLNQIDFDLSDDLWYVINDAFGNYWNNEVGLGNYFDNESMFYSVKKWINKRNFMISDEHLFKIVETITSFILSIPGVVIHDD